jgi:hypothetical protein
MLYTNTIDRETLELLEVLAWDEALDDFHLAGDAALALHLGHRRVGRDLELFSTGNGYAWEIEGRLVEKHAFRVESTRLERLRGTIGGVNVTCITDSCPLLEPVCLETLGIRLYGLKDLAAMTLAAIAGNDARRENFVDVACLSTRMSFLAMLRAFKEKYPRADSIGPCKGITSRARINRDEPIIMSRGAFNWELVEKRLLDMLGRPDVIFPAFPVDEKHRPA